MVHFSLILRHLVREMEPGLIPVEVWIVDDAVQVLVEELQRLHSYLPQIRMVAPFFQLLQYHFLDLVITKPTALKESVKGGAAKANKFLVLIFAKPIILPVPFSELAMFFIQISDSLFLIVGAFLPIEKIIAAIDNLFYDGPD